MSRVISKYKDRLKGSPLFKDSFWALLGSVMGKGLSLLAGIVVARFLGRDIYGEYGIIKSTLLNISVFSTLGLGYTGTRFISKAYADNKGDVKHIIRIIYRITCLSSSFMAILLLAFANQIAVVVKAPNMTIALRMTAIIIIFNAINTAQIGVLSGLKQFRQIAINNTYAGLLTFLTSTVFTYYWDLNGALLSLFISMLFNAIINNISIRCFCRQFEDKRESAISTSSIVSFSIPIALQESLYSIVAWLGSYLIIFYANYGELGIYSAALQWSSIILFIPGVLKNVLLSYFSSSKKTSVLRKKMIAINFVTTFILWLCVIVFSGLITGFYGATYSNLRIVLCISCITPIFSSISSVIIYEFISYGENWRVFFIRLLRDLCTLLIIWFSLRHFSNFQASLLVSIVTSIVAFIFMLVFIISVKSYDRKLNFNDYE